MPQTRRPLASAAVSAALAVTLMAGAAAGQDRVAPGHAVVQLADEPVVMPEEGLRFFVPDGSVWQRVRGAGSTHMQITAADSTWVVNAKAPRSSNTSLTASEVAERIRDQVVGRGVLGTQLIEQQSDLVIGGQSAERFYASIPAIEGQPPIVRGYTVLALGPGRFATFEFVTARSVFERTRAEYELLVGTSTSFDPVAAAEKRSDAREAGTRFLAGLTSEDLARAIAAHGEQWHRLHSPSDTGADADATELSYRRVRAGEGNRTHADDGSIAAEAGYLVQIDSRFLNRRLTGTQVIDSSGSFWMSPDRTKESWTLKLTINEPGQNRPTVWTERGRRENGELNVSITDSQGQRVRYSPVIEPAATLTHVERFLLPTLLAQRGQAGALSFGVWSSRETKVVFRTDELSRSETGRWKIASKLTENADAQQTLLSADGELIRTTLPTGAHTERQIWEPVETTKLMALWRDKNLPLD